MTAEPAALAALAERYEHLPIEWIHISKTNPRAHVDDARLAELVGSVREKGVIQPILVRDISKPGGPQKFEIVAGERRFRASKLAERTHVPAVIRALTNEQVLEIQLIENIHRKDLTALEQAVGYRALIKSNPDKHSATSIALRIGMSEAWVWDRLKLNDLIPEAKKLLEQEKIAVGHAILVSRQTAANQKRLIDPDAQLLFVGLEHGLEFDGDGDPKEKPGPYDDVKPVSVRELEAAIAHHIRFDLAHAAKAVPLQFETVAAQVKTAAAVPGRGKKVISITFAHGASEDTKDESERTYGRPYWARADGTKKTTPINSWGKAMKDSPTCGFSVLGLVVSGDEHYGETFTVCVNRDKCKVHWGKEIAAREKNQRARESGKGVQGNRAKQQAAIERRDAAEAAKRANAQARWDFFSKALKKAVNVAVEKLPAKLPAILYIHTLKSHRLPPDTKPGDLARALAVDAIRTDFNNTWRNDEATMVKWGRILGVDVKACEPPAKTAEKKKGAAA